MCPRKKHCSLVFPTKICFLSGQPIPLNEVVLAEFGSLQLELVHLSQLTGDDKYERAGNGIIEKIAEVPSRVPGLYPIIWTLDDFSPKNSKHIYPTCFNIKLKHRLHYNFRWR